MAPLRPDADSSVKPVLVVEDDPHLRKLMRTLLEYEGLTVVDAEDGLAGLQAALECSPSCIVTDTMMPNMDGITMLRELRARKVEAPALVVSAAFNIPVGDERRQLGISRVIRKPFSFDDLIKTVKNEIAIEAKGSHSP